MEDDAGGQERESVSSIGSAVTESRGELEWGCFGGEGGVHVDDEGLQVRADFRIARSDGKPILMAIAEVRTESPRIDLELTSGGVSNDDGRIFRRERTAENLDVFVEDWTRRGSQQRYEREQTNEGRT